MSNLTILCVDDEINILAILRTQLQRNFPEYTIEIAESAEEALEVIEELRSQGIQIPLVIADQVMPRSNGDEFLIEIHIRYPEILQVMLTEKATAEDVGNMVNQGNLYRFISKPWHEMDLSLTVKSALERYTQKQTIAQQQLSLQQTNSQLKLLNANLENLVQERTELLQKEISDRQQTEVNLRISETKNQTILRAIPDLLLRVKSDGTCLEFILPRDATNFLPVKHHLSEVLTPEHLEAELQLFAQVLTTGEMGMIEHQLIKHGKITYEEVRVTACSDDELLLVVRDVSDRKCTEEALKQSESQQLALLSALPDLIMRINREGVYLDFLPAKTFEVFADPDTVIGARVDEILPPDLAEKRMTAIHSALHTNKMQIYEQEVWIEGILQNEECRVVVSGEDEVIVVARDISDRKQSELDLLQALEAIEELNSQLEQRVQERTEELYQARKFLRAIIDNIPLGLFVKDGRPEYFGKFLLWNNTSEVMFRVSKDRAIGKTNYDFFSKEQSDYFTSQDRSAFENGKIENISEEVVYIPTLGTRILHTSKVPIFDETSNPKYLLGITQDITDRRQVEINLLESEERFRATFEQAAVGIVQADLNGKYIQFNQKFHDILGYSNTELLLKSVDEITHPDDIAEDKHNFSRLLTGELSTFSMEKRLISKNGEFIWANLSVSLARNLEGEPQYSIGIIQDISDRKQAEAERDLLLKELSTLNFSLERKVFERTEELSEALTNLKSTQQELILSGKMAALGQLNASIAHEINTPLGVIRGAASNIVASFHTALHKLPQLLHRISPAQFLDFITLVNTSLQQPSISTRAERQLCQEWEEELNKLGIVNPEAIAFELILLRLAPESLIFSSILRSPESLEILQVANSLVLQSQNIQSIQQEVDRAAKIVFALKTYSHQSQSEEKSLIKITDSIEVALALYENRFKQGIEVARCYDPELPKILGNPDQLTQVWVNLIDNAIYAIGQQGKLEIMVEQQADFLMIEITDSGRGIPIELLHQLFDPFFTTKPRGEGSGLGLDIVKQIILKHDGDIQVRSEVGQTTFSILLPVWDFDND